jgi:hypothetical protein
MLVDSLEERTCWAPGIKKGGQDSSCKPPGASPILGTSSGHPFFWQRPLLQHRAETKQNYCSSNNESILNFFAWSEITYNYLSSFVQRHLDSGLLPKVDLRRKRRPSLANMWAGPCMIVNSMARILACHC